MLNERLVLRAHSKDAVQFGVKLYMWRNDRDLSLSEVFDATGIYTEQLSRFESGDRVPSIVQTMNLLNLYGVKFTTSPNDYTLTVVDGCVIEFVKPPEPSHTFRVGLDQPDNEAFGCLLKAIRTNRAFSLWTASQNTGLLMEEITLIEQGEWVPRIAVVLNLLKAYGERYNVESDCVEVSGILIRFGAEKLSEVATKLEEDLVETDYRWNVGPDEPDNEKFGEFLNLQRNKLGLTRRQVAANLNCSPEYVRLIEIGQRSPTLELAKDILRYYNVIFVGGPDAIQVDNLFIKFTGPIQKRRMKTDKPVTEADPGRGEMVDAILVMLAKAEDEQVRSIYERLFG